MSPKRRTVDRSWILNALTLVAAFVALAWFGYAVELVRRGLAAGAGYGAVQVGCGTVLLALVPLALAAAVASVQPRPTELQWRTGDATSLDLTTRWWWWLASIGLIAGWLVGSILIVHNGARGLATAFDDPDLRVQCTPSVRERCISTTRAVVHREYGTMLWVDRDDRRVGLRLLAHDLPEDGTHVVLESRDGVLVSVREAHSGRRWRTQSWPRHWHGVARSLAVMGAGFVLLAFLVAVSAWGLVWQLRLQAPLTGM